MSAQPTPRPWRVDLRDDGVYRIDAQTADGWRFVARMLGEDQRANARLIAAAPDLYEAVKAWEQWEADLITEHQPNVLESMSTELYDRMLALQTQRNSAIDKAEGRS